MVHLILNTLIDTALYPDIRGWDQGRKESYKNLILSGVDIANFAFERKTIPLRLKLGSVKWNINVGEEVVLKAFIRCCFLDGYLGL